MDIPPYPLVPFLDEILFMKDYDMSSKYCVSVHESFNSDELKDMRPDPVSLSTLLNYLLKSQREMTDKLVLVNYENDVVMD